MKTASLIFAQLRLAVGDSNIITNDVSMFNYAVDFASREKFSPLAVVKPSSSDEVAAVVRICNEHDVSITVRGGGTGVSGGTFTGDTSIVLSLEKLNRILEINTVDRVAIVEAGVVTENLQIELMKSELYLPQNISSSSSSFIGGNVAVSSGSPKSLKYGPTKNYVLNLEVVLADGEIIWTGKNVEKNATGYNLTQLFAGSEGTLGIITKVVLKVVRLQQELLVMVPFQKIDKLFEFVKAFYSSGFEASALEFIDRRGFELTSAYLKVTHQLDSLIDGILWIELEGSTQDQILNNLAPIASLIQEYTNEEAVVGQTRAERERLWSLRKKIGEAVSNYARFRDVDIVVPLSKVDQMYKEINAVVKQLKLQCTVFGHIGSGNFHINIFNQEAKTTNGWEHSISLGIEKIFEKAILLGGTISGEHGIGTVQKRFVKMAIAEKQLQIMRDIKRILDHKNLLNSQNLFPE